MLRKSLVVAGLAAAAVAHPHTERSTSILGKRSIDVRKFAVPLEAHYSNAASTEGNAQLRSLSESFQARGSRDYVSLATEVVKRVIPGSTFRVVDDHYVDANGVAHVYFKQTVHGLDVENADFNVNIKNGKIVSYGNTFFQGALPASKPASRADYVAPAEAAKAAVKLLNLPMEAGSAKAVQSIGSQTEYTIEGTTGAQSNPTAKLAYVQGADGKLTLTWRVETDTLDNWLLTFVDAKSNDKVVHAIDYVADVASYQVFPWTVESPESGVARSTITDPWNKQASPNGWHGVGNGTVFKATRGNNGIAQANFDGGSDYLNEYRPASDNLTFVYPYDVAASDPKTNKDSSVTQLFYTANMYHDLVYQLGFNEKAGNFEADNGSNGGKGDDEVILNSQDGSGTNNANFATPPDGQHGRMRMYIFTTATPKRDAAFDASVVIHEHTHGVSNRLTGGPGNTQCLNGGESGGMGEGWSDWFALVVLLKKGSTRATDFPMGPWVANNPKGIRKYVYSTNNSTNPYKFSMVKGSSEVHAIGELWATFLYEVFWNIVEANGGLSDATAWPTFKGTVPVESRWLAMKIVLDGLALQPCNPTFITARDAIIDADKNLTGGKNACAIWKGFAKRGLGSSAKKSGSNNVDGFDVPASCSK